MSLHFSVARSQTAFPRRFEVCIGARDKVRTGAEFHPFLGAESLYSPLLKRLNALEQCYGKQPGNKEGTARVCSEKPMKSAKQTSRVGSPSFRHSHPRKPTPQRLRSRPSPDPGGVSEHRVESLPPWLPPSLQSAKSPHP